MNSKVNNTFKVFTLLVFSVLLLPNIFMDGIFMDGLIYATLGHNLANGIGSFWYPSFSSTVSVVFFEHPPLVFGIQSLFFRMFGDAFYIEKIFSLFNAVISAFLVGLIWRKTSINSEIKKLYWVPILLWISIPKVFWSYNNNMLENTMTVFSLAAIYVLFQSIDKVGVKKTGLIIVAAMLIIFSFLSKGFPGIFPLVFYFIYFLTHRNEYWFSTMIKDTFLLVFTVAFIFGGFLSLYQPAFDSLSKYIGTQVFESLNGDRVVGSRWYIISVLFQEIVGILIIILVLNLVYYKKALFKKRMDPKVAQVSFLFLLIGFSASVPIMISPKQLSFYIVPSLPYFAMGLSYLIANIVYSYTLRIQAGSLGMRIFKYFNGLLFVLVIALSINNYGGFERDRDLIEDIVIIGDFLGEKKMITIKKPLSGHWSLMAYFQRKYYINLDRSGKMHQYVLKASDNTSIKGYLKVDLELHEMQLWKKNSFF